MGTSHPKDATVASGPSDGEVWQVLGAVQAGFGRYNEAVDRIGKQLTTAANSVDALGVRTRAMNRRLKGVETLPEAEAAMLLGFGQEGEAVAEEEVLAAE
jgi:DNA recombination protein RmuC